MKTGIVHHLLRYFFQGLLLIAPLGITVYVLFQGFVFLDGIFQIKDYPGIGLLMILFLITFLGFLGSTILAKPIFTFMDVVISRVPGVNIIHSAVKDLFSAVVGEKKKFKQPVLITLNRENNVQKIGFITQEDLTHFGILDKISVYVPHSYAVSGDLFVVPRENIEFIKASTGDIMKFIVSGGVSIKHTDLPENGEN